MTIEDVYRQHHPRLWRALLAYCADPGIASDAESEAYAQALRRGDAIRDPAAWIWRAAFRIANGMLKDRSAQRPASVLADLAGAETSLAEFIGMLGNLSEQQRVCVTMRYVGNFTPAEIADMLGTTPGTIRVQLHRAHGQLRRELDPEGDSS